MKHRNWRCRIGLHDYPRVRPEHLTIAPAYLAYFGCWVYRNCKRCTNLKLRPLRWWERRLWRVEWLE